MSGYSEIRQSEDTFSERVPAEIDELDKDDTSMRQRYHQRSYESWFLRSSQTVLYVSLAIFAVSIGLNFLLAGLLASNLKNAALESESKSSAPASDKNCIQYVSGYTPAIDSIDYFETNIYDAYHSNGQYVGPPTKERERIWLELWQHEAIMVETWAMALLNVTDLDPYEKVEGEPTEGYNALFQVHHQLACLDLIRQYTWFQSGDYAGEVPIPLELQKSPEENRRHVDQCIDELRMSLMCHGDMTPLLITKKRNKVTGYKADSNTHYMCRNYTKLQEWTKDHGVEHWELGGGRGPHSHDRM